MRYTVLIITPTFYAKLRAHIEEQCEKELKELIRLFPEAQTVALLKSKEIQVAMAIDRVVKFWQTKTDTLMARHLPKEFHFPQLSFEILESNKNHDCGSPMFMDNGELKCASKIPHIIHYSPIEEEKRGASILDLMKLFMAGGNDIVN